MPEQHHATKENFANKLSNRQAKIFEKTQDALDYSGT